MLIVMYKLGIFSPKGLHSLLFTFKAISTILDKQSMLFVDTADMLARMSRETLVKARWVN